MKIVHVSFFYNEKLADEEALLREHYTITGWAEALQRKGAEVTVINRFKKEGYLEKNGVKYHFVQDRLGGTFKAWQTPLRCLKIISRLDADIIHLHNFSLSPQTLLLRSLLDKKTAIVIQHHGGPAPAAARKFFHCQFNNVADAFFFTAAGQGKDWLSPKQLNRVIPVVEGTTFFNFEDRDAGRQLIYKDRSMARTKTNMNGSPVFISVGNLIPRKDPLIVLDAFAEIFKQYPGARLHLVYNTTELLNEVNKKIAGDDLLKTRVQLLGKIAHDDLELYYNSADYFVLGSHAEGSGYALSEAMSCGCVPIITHIPSFRVMTDEGRLGALWEPGNKDSLIAAVNTALNKPLLPEAKACIVFYKTTLSFDAIAKKAMLHYRNIVDQRLLKVNKIY